MVIHMGKYTLNEDDYKRLETLFEAKAKNIINDSIRTHKKDCQDTMDKIYVQQGECSKGRETLYSNIKKENIQVSNTPHNFRSPEKADEPDLKVEFKFANHLKSNKGKYGVLSGLVAESILLFFLWLFTK